MPALIGAHQPEIIGDRRGKVRRRREPADAVRMLRPAGERVAGGRPGEVVAAPPRVGVEQQQALFLALEGAHELHQQDMLEHIRKVARMIKMPVVHEGGPYSCHKTAGNDTKTLAPRGGGGVMPICRWPPN